MLQIRLLEDDGHHAQWRGLHGHQVTQECARAFPLGSLPAPAENKIHTFCFFSSTLIDGLPCLLPKNRRKGQVIRVVETLEGPPGRKQKFMVMESWGNRASMAGGL